MDEARQLRDYWFGRLPLGATELAERMRVWFGGGPAEEQRERDEELRERFGTLFERAARGELDGWADGPRRRLSLILLLDQVSRNVHRGTALAFACDGRALELALTGMQSGADAALDPVERMFFYMPLQHSEAPEAQEESVAAFRRLLAEAPGELRGVFEASLKYAELHRDLIHRFGRFPHRNRVLGRASTREEQAYLDAGAERFGQ